MMVGHGTSIIDVEPGTSMGGYGDRTSGTTGVHDPLAAHAIVWRNEDRDFAIVVCDLVCVNRDIVTRVRRRLRRETGLNDTWLSATHTHASPDTGCRPGGGETPLRIAHAIEEAAMSAVAAAQRATAPATMAQHRAVVAGVGGIRSRDLPSDFLPFDVVSFEDRGFLTGALVVSPIHPTVLGADNTLLSADLNGGIRRALERELGCWVVVATGAAGDISTRPFRRAQIPDEIDRLGTTIAVSISSGLEPGKDIDDDTIDIATVSAALRPRSPEETDELLMSATTEPLESSARTKEVFAQGRAMSQQLRTAGHDRPFRADIGAVRLGRICLIGIPGEPYLSIADAIRHRSGCDAITLGYTNGYLGYIPDEDAQISYEVLASPLQRGSSGQIVDAAISANRSLNPLPSEKRKGTNNVR